MISFIFIVVLSSACVNKEGDNSTLVASDGDPVVGIPFEEPDGHDGKGNGNPGSGEGTLVISGCMLESASNYDSSANSACTTDCVDGKTGANCCCED